MAAASFDIEAGLLASGFSAVIGCDEAGRGCLAGPVVGAAAWIDVAGFPAELLGQICDSKKLCERRREEIFCELCALPASAFCFEFHAVSAAEIDEINILRASLLAMRTAYEKLFARIGGRVHAIIDGNKTFEAAHAIAVVKGDAKSLSIAAASIIAKVMKDKLLGEIGERHPAYDFAGNKGYPTASHIAALQKLGACPEHRKTYAPVRKIIDFS